MTIQKQEIEIVNLAKIMMNVETSSEQLETKQQQMKMLTEETGLVQASIQQKNEEIKQVNIEGLSQEKELKALAEILEQKPEEALAKAQCEMDELTQKIPKLMDELTQLPMMQPILPDK